MKRAIFPGSFDPFTIGHYSIVMRGLNIFDEIVIGIGVNQSKKTLFPIEERLRMIQQSFQKEPRIKVQPYDCLTVDFAKEVDATFILRGLRTVADFEYERSMADANNRLAGIETVILYTESDYAFISSSVVRDLYAFGKDIKPFLAPNIMLSE